MRKYLQMLLLIMLVGAMILGAVACTTGTPSDTKQSTAVTTNSKTPNTTSTNNTTAPNLPDTPIEGGKAKREQLTFDAAVTITEENGVANVTHADGLCYRASGYTSLEGSKLHFTKGLVLQFDSALTASEFNRFTLGYVSTQPLYGKVTYTLGDNKITDDFYLEAGTDTFSCVISQYLDKKMGKEITEMSFESCNDQPAEFALCVLRVQEYPVYSGTATTYYIENERFKLGIRLAWGGGINYLLDKECDIKSLRNLINNADTGRLIQQSYYGVIRNDEYEPGEFNGTEWCYNPIQGGDKYLNHSRIIDIVVKESSVYVKAQAMDWAKKDYLTPAYMENSYTLHEDRIEVDNRFVDFSGWTHRLCHQELPAFYTVSYLSAFSFYNGTKPWTGDTMSYRNDLNFWGDPLLIGDCTFRLRESNTETWCAWTSPTDGYGIGLYVPGIDTFKAGCYKFDNSKSANSSSTNYVAPLMNMTLKSFEPIEYSYLLTTGTVQEMRDLFTEHRDFATNESLEKSSKSMRLPDDAEILNEYYYDQSGKIPERKPEEEKPAEKPEENKLPVFDLTLNENSSLIITTRNTLVKFDSAETGTKLTVTGDDPNVTISLGDTFQASDFGKLVIVYMLPESNSPGNNVMDLFICVGSIKAPHPDARVRVSLVADGEYHTIEVDLTSKEFWTGTIHSIRIDYLDSCKPDDVIYLKSVALE